jgi:membrane peptidoglycan carboxypeptidase
MRARGRGGSGEVPAANEVNDDYASQEYDSPDYDSQEYEDAGSTGMRGLAERMIEAGRSMSRQFSAMMGRAGQAVRREAQSVGQHLAGPPSSVGPVAPQGPVAPAGGEPGELTPPPFRRSRTRLLARRWRERRVRPNPLGYFIGVASAILLASVLLGAGGAGGAYAASYYYQNHGLIQDAWAQRVAQATRIYDRNGEPLYIDQASSGFQFYIPYSQMQTQNCATCSDHNNWLIKATVDIEDPTFWSNPGVDLYSVIRASVADTSSGGAQQGASTITQQLVKILVLHNSERTLTRKIHEAILSYGVTQEYEKWQILEMYLNNIPYGDDNTGIEAATRNFFGLDVKKAPDGTVLETATQQLDLAQAAILARLPNAPTFYLPIGVDQPLSCPTAPCPFSTWHTPNAVGNELRDYDGAQTVLEAMKKAGDITQGQEDQAMAEVSDIFTNQHIYHWKYFNSISSHSHDVTKRAPHFVNAVIDELVNQFGLGDPSNVARAGLTVYTTLDLQLEQELEKDATNYVDHPFTRYWYCGAGAPAASCQQGALKDTDNVHNAAGVAIDPWTGDVLAMMGSVDYGSTDPQVKGFVNMTTAWRSMGSATKPLVYATAFQMGWNPGTMLQDIPVCYPGQQPLQPGQTTYPIDPAAPACQGYYVPHDFFRTEFDGRFPVRFMLDNSLNIPATEAMAFVGDSPQTSQNFLSMAGRMGITVCKQQQCDVAHGEHGLSAGRMGPTTALGTQEIPLVQLTSAYGTFPTGGRHTPYRLILRIDRNDGTTLYTAPQPQLQQALSPQAAYMITAILTDNKARAQDFGFNNPLYPPAYPSYLNYPYVAAKTGTATGGVNDLTTDIITMGYSPFMALGIWAGNTDGNDPLTNVIGITGAGYIFHDVMVWAIKHYKWPAVPFAVPPHMVYAQLNCTTGLAPYKGVDLTQTANVACPWTPYATGSGNLYSGYGTTALPNWDWTVDNMIPDVS